MEGFKPQGIYEGKTFSQKEFDAEKSLIEEHIAMKRDKIQEIEAEIAQLEDQKMQLESVKP